MKDADVLIALSKPGPDEVKPQWIKSMADKAREKALEIQQRMNQLLKIKL